jgi:hypothetical protein
MVQMPMGTENERVGADLTVSREPKGPKRSGDKGTVGDQAVMDAIIIIGICWLVVFSVWFSLRSHNV